MQFKVQIFFTIKVYCGGKLTSRQTNEQRIRLNLSYKQWVNMEVQETYNVLMKQHLFSLVLGHKRKKIGENVIWEKVDAFDLCADILLRQMVCPDRVW